MNSHEVFIHIHQGCFAGTGAIVRLPQCQWSKPDGYGKMSQYITTTKHSKAKTVSIFLGIYCTNIKIGHVMYNKAISHKINTLYLIQYMAQIWPRYSLRGLHICITWFSSKTKWYSTIFDNCFECMCFKCIVSTSVTKSELVRFVMTGQWWCHRTNYGITEAYPALCNILTVHLNNGATHADLRGIPKQCEVIAKAGHQSTSMQVILMQSS